MGTKGEHALPTLPTRGCFRQLTTHQRLFPPTRHPPISDSHTHNGIRQWLLLRFNKYSSWDISAVPIGISTSHLAEGHGIHLLATYHPCHMLSPIHLPTTYHHCHMSPIHPPIITAKYCHLSTYQPPIITPHVVTYPLTMSGEGGWFVIFWLLHFFLLLHK